MKKMIFFLLFTLSLILKAQCQTDVDRAIKLGEVLATGLSFFKVAKTNYTGSINNFVESVCVRNKYIQRVRFNIYGLDEQGNEVKKELILQKDGKECLLNLFKGIYIYEVVLDSDEIYRRGEYKFEESLVITVK